MIQLNDKIAQAFSAPARDRSALLQEILRLAWDNPAATADWIVAQQPPPPAQHEFAQIVSVAAGCTIDYGKGQQCPWTGEVVAIRLDRRDGHLNGLIRSGAQAGSAQCLVAAFTQAVIMRHAHNRCKHSILEAHKLLVEEEEIPSRYLGLGAAMQHTGRRSAIGVSGVGVTAQYLQDLAPGRDVGPGTFQGLLDWQFARLVALLLNRPGRPRPNWQELRQIRDLRLLHR